jgi:hypothetical protein
MKKAVPSGLVEFRRPQYGPLSATAPDEERLEAPIKNLIDRKIGFVHGFKNPVSISSQDRVSTSTDVAVDVASSLEDVVLRTMDTIQEKDRLAVLQQWEGFVTEVYSDSFLANLIDMTAAETDISEEAELPMSDLSSDDRKILQQGAVFRWLIGYRISPRDTRQRFSSILLRRVAGPTDDQISEMKREARHLARSTRWE